MKVRRLVVACALLLTFGCDDSSGGGGTGGGGSPAITPTLTVEAVVEGLDKPWDVGWLPPDGKMVVTERSGRLTIDAMGSPTVLTIANVQSTGGEGGLLGLEVDPNYASNRYVFLCMGSNALTTGTDVRVVRLTLNADATDIEARQDIVIGIPHQTSNKGRHTGCRPRFGPDGFLWVGTGDAAIGTTPQDDGSLGGKVLRVDREGNAATGNAGGLRWHSKGHRNIQGMAFRADGLGVSAEHGPSTDDELNELVAGNFGWDPVPEYTESVPMTDKIKFENAIDAIWSSGSPTLAPSGAAFIEGSQWGAWDGAVVVAMLKASHLRVFLLSDTNAVTEEIKVVDDRGRLRSPRQGPDGNLYITTDGGGGNGQVLKVTPSL